MTLFELSLRNARRQARDYLVYFVTIVLAAALTYAFNGLVFSEELQALSSMMDALPAVVVLVSAVVVWIIGWLVSYTTKFMLQKRSRELGTYILIGLENRQVARLFFLENLCVGAVALALGIVLGNLVFQALRAITLALFHVPYTFGFAFSLRAVLLTLGYFALIYLLALGKSRRSIRRMKICQLIDFERQNEGEVIHRERARRRLFAGSIVLGVAGTVLIMMQNLPMGLLGAAFLIAFLYGFFISFSSGVPGYFERRPEQKFRNRTLLVFRTLSAKLGTMGVLMATISLLFTGTLIAEGTGIIFHALFQGRAEQTTCFDLFIGTEEPAPDRFDGYLAYVDANIPVRRSLRYDVYEADGGPVTRYIQDSSVKYSHFYDRDCLMRESDYRALRDMLGYPAAELRSGTYTIHCMTYLKDLLSAYGQPLEVGGRALAPGAVYTENFTQSLWDGNGNSFVLVVPDELLEGQSVSHRIYAAQTDRPVVGQPLQGLCQLRDEMPGEGYDTIFSKASAENENAALCAIIVFPLYYLALVLTMVAATILTIQQLSEAGRYRRQFQMLSDLGMDRREMLGALRAQFAIFYAMPALPPVLIGVPFLAGLGNTLDAGIFTGPAQLLATVALALGLFFGIYLVYILAAYTSLKRSVLPG